LNADTVCKYINPLIGDGRLKRINYMSSGNWSRVVDANYYVELKPQPDRKEVERRIKYPTGTDTEIADFCQTPKSRQEVAERFGFELYIARRYLDRLVKNGKLKCTFPLSPGAKPQRFVIPTANVIILSETELLTYCETPRTTAEIIAHFGNLTPIGMWHVLNPFVKAGKLINTAPANSHNYRLVTAKSGDCASQKR
jgi:hypothetical protein